MIFYLNFLQFDLSFLILCVLFQITPGKRSPTVSQLDDGAGM